MHCKNDNIDINNKNNDNNSFNNSFNNLNLYSPVNQSSNPTYDDFPDLDNPDDDYYRVDRVNSYNHSHTIDTGSRNISFNAKSIFIIFFVALYAAFIIPIFHKTLKAASIPDENATLVVEGTVKNVTTSRKQVSQWDGRVISTEKVFTATYEFKVDGKTYGGEYDSLNEVKANAKIDVVYKLSNPAENHRQTAEESVKPKMTKQSKLWFNFIIIALIPPLVFSLNLRTSTTRFISRTIDALINRN